VENGKPADPRPQSRVVDLDRDLARLDHTRGLGDLQVALEARIVLNPTLVREKLAALGFQRAVLEGTLAARLVLSALVHVEPLTLRLDFDARAELRPAERILRVEVAVELCDLEFAHVRETERQVLQIELLDVLLLLRVGGRRLYA